MLRARVWVAQVGRIPLLLLDSDIPENDHDLRNVTDRLYGGDQEHRIKQELLAGIGGVRAIRAFTAIKGQPDAGRLPHERGPCRLPGSGAHPGVHGGSSSDQIDFDTALTIVRSSRRCSPPTPRYRPASTGSRWRLVERYFGDEADSALLPGVPIARVLAFGAEVRCRQVQHGAHGSATCPAGQRGFATARPSQPRDVRGAVAGFDAAEVPIGSITNGVHGPTWAAREWLELGRELAGSTEAIARTGGVGAAA